jgi:hypothetical protein
MKPEGMSELEHKGEKLAIELGRHYGDGAEALVRELVAEVRRLRADHAAFVESVAEGGKLRRLALAERDSIASKLATAVEALRYARDELGVPQPGYPAPVANAAERIRAALRKVEGGDE